MVMGLVLSGGGARGGYEIGALKALDELGFKYDVITGTSVGALISLMLLSDKKELLYETWDNMDYGVVIEHDFKTRNKTLESFCSGLLKRGLNINPLEKLVEENLDEYKVRNNIVKSGLVYTEGKKNYKGMKIEDIPVGELGHYLLTSCSAYPFLKKRIIDGKECKDGFYTDNMPINLAIQLGATKIFAIDIMNGRKVKKTDNIEVYCLKPSKKLKFFLDFSNKTVKEYIALGYKDVMGKQEEILNFINN